MNREEIEKAVAEYAAKANPSFSNGDFDRNSVAQAFEDGANWRINSVWHDPDKGLPEPEIDVLVEYEEEGGNKMYCFSHISINSEIVKDIYGFCFYIPEATITRWAYVSDLLPERKEADNA